MMKAPRPGLLPGGPVPAAPGQPDILFITVEDLQQAPDAAISEGC